MFEVRGCSRIMSRWPSHGSCYIRLQNRPLAGNPKSSEMTALNLVRMIENRTSALVLSRM